MARARKNAFRGRMKKATRSSSSQSAAAKIKKAREEYRRDQGKDWWQKPAARASYESRLAKMGLGPKEMLKLAKAGKFKRKTTSSAKRAAERKFLHAYADQMGLTGAAKKAFIKRRLGSASSIYKMSVKKQKGVSKAARKAAQTSRLKYAGMREQLRVVTGVKRGAKKAATPAQLKKVFGDDTGLVVIYQHEKAKRKSGGAKTPRRKGQIFKSGGPKVSVGRKSAAQLAREAKYKAGRAEYDELRRTAKALGISTKGKKKQQLAADIAAAGVAVANPSLAGLALENAGMMQTAGSFVTKSIPSIAAGTMLGVIPHVAASTVVLPGIDTTLTAWVEETAEKVPAVGSYLAKVPHALQGSLVGLVSLPLAAFAASQRQPQVAAFLGAMGASAVGVGVALDGFALLSEWASGMMGGSSDEDYISEDEFESELEPSEVGGLAFGGIGGLALDNVSALGMGGLALDNVGGLALDNLGDGFASETAPLAVQNVSALGDMYGQSSLADAYHCGPDFSGAEGQALMNGPSFWERTFGRPVHRLGAHTAQHQSHLAGQHGHRWGWLIKTVGWKRAQAICALPPAQRLRVIKKLRQAAVAAYQQMMVQAQAVAVQKGPGAPELEPAAGTITTGAQGASSVNEPEYLNGAYGDPALFMGA